MAAATQQAFWRRLLRPAAAPAPIIMAFHRIAEHPADELSLPPAVFRALCRHWRARYEVTTLERILSAAPGEGGDGAGAAAGGGPPRLALTFDDGYADNFETAAPILAEFGFSATFFLATDFIGSNRSFPWDANLRRPPRIMNWDQARELLAAGFALGSHTRSHPRLAKCDNETAARELRESRAELEQRLGAPVLDFAYPFGGAADCREANRAAARAAGYRCCLSCHGGRADARDPFHLNRVSASPVYHATPRDWERQMRRI